MFAVYLRWTVVTSLFALGLTLMALALEGCSDEVYMCTGASDCPTGELCSDGVCTPVITSDTGAGDVSIDAGRDAAADQIVWPDLPPGDGPSCKGNANGTIERSEMVLAVPTTLAYTMGTAVTVDLKGSTSGGKTVWDLTGAASDDHTETMKLAPVPSWSATKFPKADYVSLLDKKLGTLGVFRVTQSAMKLMGAISGKASHGRITYTTEVDLLRFPISPGDTFSTSTTATGYWGLATIYNTEKHTVQVLGFGDVKLPKITLPSVLVKITMEQYVYSNPFLKSTTTLFLFISECYGTVARVVVNGDPGGSTTFEARERWRLAGP